MQFDRVADLTVGKPGGSAKVFAGGGTVTVVDGQSIRHAGFKIRFEISKDVMPTPNEAKIEIFNLAKATRDAMKQYQGRVILNAGYAQDGGAQLLFTGQVYIIDHIPKPPHILSRITCGDGFGVFREKRMSMSLGPGAKAAGALQTIASAMGLPIKNLPGTDAQFPNGYSEVGAAQEHLRKAAAAANFEVGVQDGMIVLVPRYNTTNEPAVLVSARTGMIGSPEKSCDGQERLLGVQPPVRWKVRSLLNTRIMPFRRVQLVSDNSDANGVFRVQKVRHVGDTWGQEWFSEMELCSTIVGGLSAGAAE